MRKILKDNYEAIVKRGLITKETTMQEFRAAISGEVTEVYQSQNESIERQCSELADVINACNNAIIHLGGDPDIEAAKCLARQLERLI